MKLSKKDKEWLEKEKKFREDLAAKREQGCFITKEEEEYLSKADNYSWWILKRWWICDVCGAVNQERDSDFCERLWCIGRRNKEEKLLKYKPAEQMKMKLE